MTIDTHHHIVPDFFWQETENAHAPVGGLAPLQRILQSSELNDLERHAILGANASRLFPRRFGASRNVI